MSVNFPRCSTILLFSGFTVSEDRDCYCDVQTVVEAAAFPYQFDGLSLEIFIDGEAGQYEGTFRVADSTGTVVGEGLWGRFHNNTPEKSTVILGQTQYTVPPIPAPGIYSLTLVLRRSGETKEVGVFRVDLSLAAPDTPPDGGPLGIPPVGIQRMSFDGPRS